MSDNERKLLHDLDAEARQMLRDAVDTEAQISAMEKAKKSRTKKPTSTKKINAPIDHDGGNFSSAQNADQKQKTAILLHLHCIQNVRKKVKHRQLIELTVFFWVRE